MPQFRKFICVRFVMEERHLLPVTTITTDLNIQTRNGKNTFRSPRGEESCANQKSCLIL